METYCSEQINELAHALIDVQKQMPPATKDGKNPFIGSNYATLNSVMVSSRDILLEHGIWLTQLPVPAPIEFGPGYLGLMTKLTHAESGQWQSSLTVIPLSKADPQGMGSAITYARRYALTAMLGMITELGDRSRYVGLSEIAKYSECPRAAIACKLENQNSSLEKLLVTQRGHCFEQGVKNTLAASGLNSIHQLEINLRKKSGILKAHLYFTLVWEKPIQAVRILEIKSTEHIPDEPRQQHTLQAQGQVDLVVCVKFCKIAKPASG